MACPFSSIYEARKSSAGGSVERVMGGAVSESQNLHKSNSESVPERKISASRIAEFQHQGSFTQRDDPHNKFSRGDTPTRIVWERGPSLEQLKAASGMGMVQQRVNVFSQQISQMNNQFVIPPSINRSVSSSAMSSKLQQEDCVSRKARSPRQTDDKPLLKEPRMPLDLSEPLGLKNLSEAVWTFITVPADILLQALDKMLMRGDREWKNLRRKLCIVADGVAEYDDWHIDDMLVTMIKQLEIPEEEFMLKFGRVFAKECQYLYRKPLQSLGYTLEGFFTNLIDVLEVLQQSPSHAEKLKTINDIPYLLCCQHSGQLLIHFYTNRNPMKHFMSGVIEGISECLFRRKVKVSTQTCEPSAKVNHRYYFKYSVSDAGGSDEDHVSFQDEETNTNKLRESLSESHILDKSRHLDFNFQINELDSGQLKLSDERANYSEGTSSEGIQHHSEKMSKVREEEEVYAQGLLQDSLLKLSDNVTDSKIQVSSFCGAFPWHFVCDKKMRIKQLGTALLQIYDPKIIKDGEKVGKYFDVIAPRGIPLEYKEILGRLNTAYILCIKNQLSSKQRVQAMQLKGQMVDCPESESLMFIGSPLLDGLVSLTSRGLYISDIPIHDATREVILVGEQSRAQDGLIRRMTQLKESIVEANNAVDEERAKNVSLLHLIFPPDIAKRLWLGEVIDAQKHAAVTMLFSDIVGFTSICSTATPFMVISMLQDLYTKFDAYCGQLDVYKTETIGDAYCIAGNLHRKSAYHAERVAWMAMRMLETCNFHQTHTGEPIRMRIGLHTGTVLAGVVGTVMPRYCMFGSNVSVANSFESSSEALKINVSPTTYEILNQSDRFTFEPRKREDLPDNFPEDIPGIPYFIKSFKHEAVDSSAPVSDHIEKALSEVLLEENFD